MAELTNSQITQMLFSQNEMLKSLTINKKKKPKTILNTIIPTMLMSDFIENIELINIDKLINMTLPEFYARIILHNLDKLDSNNKIIVCSDIKRKSFYYYENNNWNHDNKFLKPIKSKIFKLVCQQLLECKNRCEKEDTCLVISAFFDINKYPYEKLCDKILVCLSKIMITFSCSDGESDSD